MWRLPTLISIVLFFICFSSQAANEPPKTAPAPITTALPLPAPSVPSQPPLAGFTGDQLPLANDEGLLAYGKDMLIVIPESPNDLSGQLDKSNEVSQKLARLIYDSLGTCHADNSFTPRLAKRYLISSGGKQITFFLDKAAFFHDQKPLTAADVVFTFSKLLDKQTQTQKLKEELAFIENYQAAGPYTVVFNLKEADAFALCSLAKVLIYPKHLFQTGDFNNHPRHKDPLGSGPFKLANLAADSQILLVRNPEYALRTIYLDKLIFVPLKSADIDNHLEILREQKIDLLTNVSLYTWNTLTKEAQIKKDYWRLRAPKPHSKTLLFNQQRKLFNNAKVRQALSMLLDRNALTDKLGLAPEDAQIAADFFLENNPPSSRIPNTFLYNLTKARTLLAEAGFVDSNNDGLLDKDNLAFSFTLLIPNEDPLALEIGKALAKDYKRASIQVNLKSLPLSAINEQLSTYNFDACLVSVKLDPTQDPYLTWQELSKKSVIFSTNPNSAYTDIEKLLTLSRSAFKRSEREKAYEQVAHILKNEAPYIPLLKEYTLTFMSKKFAGMQGELNFLEDYAQLGRLYQSN